MQHHSIQYFYYDEHGFSESDNWNIGTIALHLTTENLKSNVSFATHWSFHNGWLAPPFISYQNVVETWFSTGNKMTFANIAYNRLHVSAFHLIIAAQHITLINEFAKGWGWRGTANTKRHAGKTVFTIRMPKTPQAYVSQALQHNCPHCFGLGLLMMSCRWQHDNCTCWREANKETLLQWWPPQSGCPLEVVRLTLGTVTCVIEVSKRMFYTASAKREN